MQQGASKAAALHRPGCSTWASLMTCHMSSRTQAPCLWFNICKCCMKNAWATYFNAFGGNQTWTELIVGKVKSNHVNPANFTNDFIKVLPWNSFLRSWFSPCLLSRLDRFLVSPSVICSFGILSNPPKHKVAAISFCILLGMRTFPRLKGDNFNKPMPMRY